MFERFKARKSEAIQQDTQKKTLSKKQLEEKERYVSEVMLKDKLPIIILDKQWHDVKGIVGDPSLAKKEATLLAYLKEQGALTNSLKEDSQVKQTLMDKVLHASQALTEQNTGSALEEMEKLRQALLKINETIDTTEQRLETLETDIREINRSIIEVAVAVGYEQMAYCKEKEQQLEEEIDVLRQQMLEKTAAKKQNTTELNIVYHYLHNIVGYQQLDKVDKALGE